VIEKTTLMKVCVKMSSDNVGTTMSFTGFIYIIKAVKKCEMMCPLRIYCMDYSLPENLA